MHPHAEPGLSRRERHRPVNGVAGFPSKTPGPAAAPRKAGGTSRPSSARSEMLTAPRLLAGKSLCHGPSGVNARNFSQIGLSQILFKLSDSFIQVIISFSQSFTRLYIDNLACTQSLCA